MSVHVKRYNRGKKKLEVNLLLVLLLLRVTMHSIKSNKPPYVLSSLPNIWIHNQTTTLLSKSTPEWCGEVSFWVKLHLLRWICFFFPSAQHGEITLLAN